LRLTFFQFSSACSGWAKSRVGSMTQSMDTAMMGEILGGVGNLGRVAKSNHCLLLHGRCPSDPLIQLSWYL
jgi:hypothetical protein